MVGGSRGFSFIDWVLKFMIFNKSILLYSPAGLQLYSVDKAGLKLKRSTSASALLSAGIKGMTTTSC